jgi:hypothetical protein
LFSTQRFLKKEVASWVTKRRIVILEDLAVESVGEEWMGDKGKLSPRRNLAL